MGIARRNSSSAEPVNVFHTIRCVMGQPIAMTSRMSKSSPARRNVARHLAFAVATEVALMNDRNVMVTKTVMTIPMKIICYAVIQMEIHFLKSRQPHQQRR